MSLICILEVYVSQILIFNLVVPSRGQAENAAVYPHIGNSV